mgnify:CR=1 FL=1
MYTVLFSAVGAVCIETRPEDLVAMDSEDGVDWLTILVVGIAVDSQREGRLTLTRDTRCDWTKASLKQSAMLVNAKE